MCEKRIYLLFIIIFIILFFSGSLSPFLGSCRY
jgi:hypothetical protein